MHQKLPTPTAWSTAGGGDGVIKMAGGHESIRFLIQHGRHTRNQRDFGLGRATRKGCGIEHRPCTPPHTLLLALLQTLL